MKKIYMLVLCLNVTTIMAKDIDEHKILLLNEMQRNHILTEMRSLLLGTQQILQALSYDGSFSPRSYAGYGDDT